MTESKVVVITESKVKEIVYEALREIRNKPGCFNFPIDDDLIVFGKESPLDSIIVAGFTTALTDRIEDEIGRDFFLSLPKTARRNQTGSLTLPALTRILVERINMENDE